MPVIYMKPRTALTNHERSCVDALNMAHLHLVTLPEDPTSPANIDLFMEGRLWEMKNAGDGRHAVEGAMREAHHTWTRLGLDATQARKVITPFGGSRSEADIRSDIQRRLKYARQVIFVRRDGRIDWVKT